MFATLKNKVKDVRTLSALCKQAEHIARVHGKQAPGSEHFVLASLALQDGTARNALAGLGATPEAFESAIREQFVEALGHAGIDATADAPSEPAASPRAPQAPRLYSAAPSGNSIVQRLAAAAPGRKSRPLLAADVLLAAAAEEFSIAARAMRAVGITRQQLVQAAGSAIARHEEGRAG